jgi:hypothetical protein
MYANLIVTLTHRSGFKQQLSACEVRWLADGRLAVTADLAGAGDTHAVPGPTMTLEPGHLAEVHVTADF